MSYVSQLSIIIVLLRTYEGKFTSFPFPSNQLTLVCRSLDYYFLWMYVIGIFSPILRFMCFDFFFSLCTHRLRLFYLQLSLITSTKLSKRSSRRLYCCIFEIFSHAFFMFCSRNSRLEYICCICYSKIEKNKLNIKHKI